MSGYRYLTLADRQTLEALYLEGDRVQDIADQIGVHVATVYKELKRGTSKGEGGKPTKPIARILPKP